MPWAAPGRSPCERALGRSSPTTPANGSLYNLVDDRAETRDLASERPELVKELRADLDRAYFPPPK